MKNISTNIFKMLITASVLLVCNTGVFAQTSASASEAANGTIIVPITLTPVSALNFGTIIATTTAGTVVVDTNGVRSTTGGAAAFTGSTGATVGAASFTVGGQPLYTYAITSPSGFNVSDGSGHTMAIASFITSPYGGTGVLSSGGTQTLNIGATLTVGASQASGVYTSSAGVAISVNYN